MDSPPTILHVTTQEAWTKALQLGTYRTPDLEQTGFIHFCTPQQLDFVLGMYFQGKAGLAIVHVDPKKLTAKLLYEKSEPDHPPFPHLYGPLNLDAVESVDLI